MNDSPDHSTCSNCGRAISWSDDSYVHDHSGFVDCETTLTRGAPASERDLFAKLGAPVEALERASTVIEWRIDPDIETDPAVTPGVARPVEWDR